MGRLIEVLTSHVIRSMCSSGEKLFTTTRTNSHSISLECGRVFQPIIKGSSLEVGPIEVLMFPLASDQSMRGGASC